ncbi:unnamed protein product [Discosporangium mesarthrocarpum]
MGGLCLLVSSLYSIIFLGLGLRVVSWSMVGGGAAVKRTEWPYLADSTEAEVASDLEAALKLGYNVYREIGKGGVGSVGFLDEFRSKMNETDLEVRETLYRLARAYEDGRQDLGIARNSDTARELYSFSAELGHPASHHALAVYYASRGVAEEEVKAILHDSFAAVGGDALAHASLGYRYLHGYGTRKDCSLALDHYQISARKVMEELNIPLRGGTAYPIDQTRLSEKFSAGRQTVYNTDSDVIQYWEAAAELGDVGAMRTMAMLHQTGQRGVEQDLPKSLSWYRLAAEAGDKGAAARAGDMLMRGAGAPADYEAARKHFESSEEDPVSLNGLGYLYLHGLGVETNVFKAWLYFEQVLATQNSQSHVDTLYNVGEVFLGTRLVKPGSTIGQQVKIRGVVSGSEVTLQQDLGKAIKYLDIASSKGHIEANYRAGQFYAQGLGPYSPNCPVAVDRFMAVVHRGPWMQGMSEATRRVHQGDYDGALDMYIKMAEVRGVFLDPCMYLTVCLLWREREREEGYQCGLGAGL